MPRWSCQIADLNVDSKTVVVDNFLGVDSDKLATEADSAENSIVEKFSGAEIAIFADNYLCDKNLKASNYFFVVILRQLSLEQHLLFVVDLYQ